MIAFSGEERTLSRHEVEQVMSTTAPTSIFDFVDAFGSRDVRLALRLLADLLAEGVSIFGVHAMSVRHTRNLMSTRALREYIRSLRRAGQSVVLSTHIMQEVAALCDRIVIIAKGEVAADGTPEELLERSGRESLEDAFVKLIGTEEGLLA